MSERLCDAKPDAVAAGRRHREPAGCQHHAIALMVPPDVSTANPLAARDTSVTVVPNRRVNSLGARERHQRVAHVAGAIRLWKEFARFLFEHQRNPEVVFEESALFVQRRRLQHRAQQMLRRIRDEVLGVATDGNTLHRPPPLIRILWPPSLVRSISVTFEPAAAANPAATRPAAPAPTTATEGFNVNPGFHHGRGLVAFGTLRGEGGAVFLRGTYAHTNPAAVERRIHGGRGDRPGGDRCDRKATGRWPVSRPRRRWRLPRSWCPECRRPRVP